MALHPRIAELLDYAQSRRETLLDALSLVPEPLREQRGDADIWSAAEVLEHLHRVESGIVRLLTRSLERARESGLEPETEAGSLLASLDALHILDRNLRIAAPEPVVPRGELTAAQAVVALTESRQALVSLLHQADGLALGRITRVHPILGPLNLYQWVLFVGQHEARHTEQLKDLGRGLSP